MIAYFLGLSKDIDISPPLKFVKHGELPLYRSITWKDYLNVKAKHFYDALDQIRFTRLRFYKEANEFSIRIHDCGFTKKNLGRGMKINKKRKVEIYY